MRPSRTPTAAFLPALVPAALVALLVGASSASAAIVLSDSARGSCPSCRVDDPEAPVAATTVVISGHGYGHGLGMSQYGAYGLALRGAGFQRILRFYYPGTEFGAAPVAAVKVLLAEGVSSVTVSSAQPFTAVDASGKAWPMPAADLVLDTTLALPVGPGGTPQFVAGPIVLRPQGAPLTLNGKAYRGSLKVGLVPPPAPVTRLAAIQGPGAPPTAPAPATGTPGTTTAPAPAASAPAASATAPATTTPGPDAAPAPAPGATSPGVASPGGDAAAPAAPLPRLRVVNSVGLEAYLSGVVAREMPASWPAAALQAQAVAARSYALAHRAADGDFDLYADERSQVYGGVAAEQPSTTAAVEATAGRILLYQGTIADTMFSASNGGRTVSAAQAYPDNPDPPRYLVARDDPYDAAVSPYAAWGPIVVESAQLESALGLPGALVDLTTDAPGAGRPREITAVTGSGTVVVSPGRLRAALGLRSSWVEIGVLSLSRLPAPVSAGRAVTIDGVVRGVGDAVVEQRTATGWQALGSAVPDGDGRFSIVTKAVESTALRLSGGHGSGTAVTGGLLPLPVAPRVRIEPSLDGTGLSGVVRPALSGAVIEIQYDGSGTGTTWSPVGSATVGIDGGFFASLAAASGSYRAVLPGADGLAAVPTAPVRVTIVS